jgi:hypothetical protein
MHRSRFALVRSRSRVPRTRPHPLRRSSWRASVRESGIWITSLRLPRPTPTRGSGQGTIFRALFLRSPFAALPDEPCPFAPRGETPRCGQGACKVFERTRALRARRGASARVPQLLETKFRGLRSAARALGLLGRPEIVGVHVLIIVLANVFGVGGHAVLSDVFGVGRRAVLFLALRVVRAPCTLALPLHLCGLRPGRRADRPSSLRAFGSRARQKRLARLGWPSRAEPKRLAGVDARGISEDRVRNQRLLIKSPSREFEQATPPELRVPERSQGRRGAHRVIERDPARDVVLVPEGVVNGARAPHAHAPVHMATPLAAKMGEDEGVLARRPPPHRHLHRDRGGALPTAH